ncbi:preprotein translocase subunit SecG [uncultured Desulfuromonas sp.]|uniref:preprotein translocase subunit SecG n=1 Tax=uncultured Desulfuromonas sp. TaxID=181013 RepID=UPI002AABBFC2|nr:preprotein translocase subunit SecG [uncultured Desulfuromonas sp.]
MIPFLLTVHVLVCIALIVIVLLQAGKGAEAGASFGAGASQTVFGASGGRSFMSKMTTFAAFLFMLTSLSLAYLYGKPGSDSLMPDQVQPVQTQQQQSAE